MMLTAKDELRHTLDCVKDSISDSEFEVLTRLVNRMTGDEVKALAALLNVVEENSGE